MTRFLSDLNVPALASITILIGKTIWDLKRRKGRPLGSLYGELGPVNEKEISIYLSEIEKEDSEGVYLSREARRERADVCLGYAVIIKGNALCFRMGATFDRYKISSNKLSFQFNDEQTLVWALERESGSLLWKARRCEIVLRYRKLLGMRVDARILDRMKMDYKSFEQDMIAFADMVGQGQGLRLALGLDRGWGLHGGGGDLDRDDNSDDSDFDPNAEDDSGPEAG
jgi:hypothetical protein